MSFSIEYRGYWLLVQRIGIIGSQYIVWGLLEHKAMYGVLGLDLEFIFV